MRKRPHFFHDITSKSYFSEMQNNDSNIRFPGPKFDRFVFTNKLWVKTLGVRFPEKAFKMNGQSPNYYVIFLSHF